MPDRIITVVKPSHVRIFESNGQGLRERALIVTDVELGEEDAAALTGALAGFLQAAEHRSSPIDVAPRREAQRAVSSAPAALPAPTGHLTTTVLDYLRGHPDATNAAMMRDLQLSRKQVSNVLVRMRNAKQVVSHNGRHRLSDDAPPLTVRRPRKPGRSTSRNDPAVRESVAARDAAIHRWLTRHGGSGERAALITDVTAEVGCKIADVSNRFVVLQQRGWITVTPIGDGTNRRMVQLVEQGGE